MNLKFILFPAWFLVGLIAVPWLLNLLLGIVVSGTILGYFKLAVLIVGAVFAPRAHRALAWGLWGAVLVGILETILGISVPFL